MGNFTFLPTKLDGVYIIEVKTYKESDFKDAGLNYTFVQDNQSSSGKGVLRGLHFQKKHPQAKLVRVLSGEVFDVAVDLRKGSKTYGQWVGEILSGENRRLMMIPKGFAHGFLVLSDIAVFEYKCDDFYHPEDEGGIQWDDPDIGVEWPITEDMELNLSEKDAKRDSLKDFIRNKKEGV